MIYPKPTLLAAALALLSSCVASSYSDSYSDSYSEGMGSRSPRATENHVPREIAALAQELEERASLRSSLGSARILVEALEPIGPRKGRHRFAILDEEDLHAVQDTIRYELEMALGNRLNILDPDVAIRASESGAQSGDSKTGRTEGQGELSLREQLGATHAVVGTFVRNGDLVDISVRLVDLRDGWIVATAERRIPRFVPRAAVTLGASAAARQEREGQRERRLQRTTAQGAQGAVDGLRNGSGEGPGDRRQAGQSAEAPLSTPLPQLVLAEPAPPESVATEAGIPEDAAIEFEAGPAAARFGSRGAALRVVQDGGKPDEAKEKGAQGSAPSTENRGEHH